MTQRELFVSPDKPLLSFRAAGVPVGQGSKTARVMGKVEYRGKVKWVRDPTVILVENNDMPNKSRGRYALKKWREYVSARARDALGVGHELFVRPAVLQCTFVFPRREKHFKKSGGLLSSAPTIPGHDIDKYQRAIADALTGVFYRDDRQITENWGRKRWGMAGKSPGVIVNLWEDFNCEEYA